MYCIALSLLALTALVAGSGYVPGREYIYWYRGHISAGFPDKKPQYSGLSYDAKVRVQPKGEYAIMQIQDKHYNTFNADTTKYEKQPYKYSELPKKAGYDTHPFKVYFKDGQISHFDVHKDEPTQSVNIKRSIISLFHLTFDSTDEPQNLSENEKYKPDFGEHYYKTMEDGLLGHCETQYVIEHLPNHMTPHNNIVLNITKTRNYHKCDSVPNHYYSTFHGEECGHEEYDKAHTMHGNAFFHYDIRGDRHHYVIEKVVVEGDLGFTPFPLEGQTAEIFVNRTLELIEEKDHIEKELEIDGELIQHNSLEYEFGFKPKFNDEIDLKKPHYMYHIYGKKVPLEQIREQIANIVKVYDDDTYHKDAKEKDYPALFLELVRAFSTLDYDDIAQLYKEYASFEPSEATEEKLLKRILLFDVLTNTGTNPSLLFGHTLVKSGKIPDHFILHFLQHVPFHIKEFTQAMLDEAYSLCREEHIIEKPKLYTACYLSIANVIHDRCVARYHPEGSVPHDEYSCPDEVPTTFFHELTKKYKESDDEYRKLAYITALGRLGVKESLKYLRHYVEGDAHQNLLDRSTSIYALGTIARRYPELVRELIIPLYYNTSENYVIRIAAFNMLLKTHPHLYELETIARALIDEKDDQIRSYVYSAFRSYDNSTHPCDHQLAHDVRYALAIIKPYRKQFEHYDYSYSHHHYVSGYNKDYGYGGFTKFAYLASDTGYIPRTLYMQVNDFMRGKSFNSFSIGFRQYGIEKLTDKLFGPEGALGKKSVFDLFKKRTARDVSSVEKERKEIKEKLHLPTKEYGHVDGEIFFNYMGDHMSLLYFNETSFESFLHDGAISIPDFPAMYKQLPKFRLQRFSMPLDLVYVIPSEAGFPIVMDFKQPSYFYYKNDKLKFEVKPAFFKEDRQDQPPTDVHFNVEGHVVVDKQFVGTIGVVHHLEHVSFGVSIEKRCVLSLPLNLDLDLNLREEKFDIKWKPIVPHQVYHYEYEPATYIDNYEDNLAVFEEKDYTPVRRLAFKKHETKEMRLGPFDLKLHVDKDYDNEWGDWGSLWRFLWRQDYRDKFYYLATNPHFEPYKYDVTLQTVDGQTVEEVDASFKYTHHRADEHEEHSNNFGDNGFEDHDHPKSNKNFITSNLHAEITSHGSHERKVIGEIDYARDLFRRYHKLHVYYQRSPFLEGETHDLKVCASGYLKYPKLDISKVAHLDTLEMDMAVESEIKAHFGKDCSTDQKLSIHAKFDKTDEQHELEHARDAPEVNHEHTNPYQYLYHKCLEEQHHGDIYPDSCLEYMQQSVKLNKFTFDIKHEHLSKRFLNMTYKLGHYLKHKYYDHSDTNELDVNNPDDEYHVEYNVSAIYPVADLRVRRPHSESHYDHIYLPHFHSFSAYPFYENVQVKKSLNELYCKVMGDVVSTFDHYNYDLPPIDCWKVISKDCSPMESFMILGSKINHPKYKKALKVFIGNHKVEILPLSDDSDLVIRVDGKKVPVTDAEPYYHYEKENLQPIFFVAHKDFYYALRSEKYGLVVDFDGEFIGIEVSPYYRAKLCGLCGNYNGQKYDGNEDEHGCVITNDKDYAYRFAIPSDTCSVPKVETECWGEGGVGCTDLKTEILQLETGKIPQTCFSTEPIPHCKEGCVEQSHFKRTLSYHCLPAKDDSTKHLVDEAKSRVLYEVKRKSKDHEAEIEIQEGCHRS